MKKVSIFILMLMGCVSITNAQDVILKTNGDEVNVKVQEVGSDAVKYKKADGSGPVYTIPKSEVFMITYESGDKDVFGRGQSNLTATSSAESTATTGNTVSSAGKTYNILDYYNENGVSGIVVKVTDGGQHGLIISTEMSAEPWCKTKKFRNATVAFSEDDGTKNMEAIAQFISSGKAKWEDFPLFQWAQSLGDGWYIPASDELQQVLVGINDGSMDFDYSKFDKLESKLAEYNGKTIWNRSGQKNGAMSYKYPLFRMMYSSTEAAKGKAYVVCVWVDSMGQSLKMLNTGVGGKLKAAEQPKKFPMGGGTIFGSRAFHKF
jgi:hypothetical protein